MSVQTDLEARAETLRAILEDSNRALAKKNGAPAETLAEVPLCIRGLGAGVELEVLEIEPTGERQVVDADEGCAFHRVIVAATGDGSEYPTLALPEEYLAYVEYARENLYTGDFSHLAVWETGEFVAVSFLMADFAVTAYDPQTTEIKATGWVTCGYTKATGEWTFHNFTTEESPGENYAKNIKFASCYVTYNGQTLFPVGIGAEYAVVWETVWEKTLLATDNEPLTGGGQYNGYKQTQASIVVSGWLYKAGDTVRLTVNGVSTIHTVGEYSANGYHIGNRWLGAETTESSYTDNGFDFYVCHTYAPLPTVTTYHMNFFARTAGEYTVEIERMVK